MENLKKKGISGVFWDLIGKFSNQAVTFIVSIFLARLLTPEDFGLVGMVMVIIPIAQVFMTLGLGASLVQKKEVSHQLYSSVFWINIFVGLILTIVFFLSAPVIAEFYERSELIELIQITSLVFVISSFGIVQTLRFTKEIDFKTLAKVNVSTSVISGIIGISLAYLNFGVYALIYQKLSSTFLTVFIYWIISKWRPSFHFSISELKSIVGFSSNFFLDGFITTVYNKLDVLMIGKIFHASSLGYYTRAQTLDTMVNNFSSSSLTSVFFPLISKIQDNIPKIKLLYQKSILLVGFVSIGLTSWLFLVSEELFILLFTEKWNYSAQLFKIMAIVGFTYPIGSIMISIIIGMGYAGKNMVLGFYRKTFGIIALIIGYFYGLEAFLYACIARNLIGLVINMLFIKTILSTGIIQQFSWFRVSLFIAFSLTIGITFLLSIHNLYLSIVLKTLIFTLGYLIFSYFFNQPLKKLISEEIKENEQIKKLIMPISIFIPSFIRKTHLKSSYFHTLKRRKDKIFLVGFNKTGTTSVEHALKELGFIIGKQNIGEQLLDDITMNKYDNLIQFCKTAEAFQDIPFSIPNVYKVLNEKYPNSKFILTIRDDDEQWFNSICKFHTKLWGKNGNLPTKDDLANANYIYKGYPLLYNNFLFGENYYNKEAYTAVYNKHNKDVMNFFKNNPNQLLVINVADKNSYQKLCAFLDIEPLRETFEWKNKTEEI